MPVNPTYYSGPIIRDEGARDGVMIDGQLPEICHTAPQPVPARDGRGAICREALESLPEWFAIPADIESYVSGVANLPMLARFESAGMVGFVSVMEHTAAASEMYAWASNVRGIATGPAAS
jgi:hypothetical protein